MALASVFSLPINIRQTATTTANSTVFAMRNDANSTVIIKIERIELMLGFDTATPITRSTARYDLMRFSTATPTGGTALTPQRAYSGDPASQITDARFLDTGLTTTNVVFNAAFATIGCPVTDGTTAHYTRDNTVVYLGPGEGFCIRLNVAAVIGQSLIGEIIWSER